MPPSTIIELTLESVSAREIYTSGRAKKPKLLQSFCYKTSDGRKVSFSFHPTDLGTRYFGQGTDLDLATPVVEAFLAVRAIGGSQPPLLIIR